MIDLDQLQDIILSSQVTRSECEKFVWSLNPECIISIHKWSTSYLVVFYPGGSIRPTTELRVTKKDRWVYAQVEYLFNIADFGGWTDQLQFTSFKDI